MTAYDAVASRYDEHFERDIDLAEDDALYGLVSRRSGSLLDVGCGTGHLLDYTSPDRYLGIDISSGMLAEARAKYDGSDLAGRRVNPRLNFIHGAAEDVRGIVAPRTFDTAVSFWAFSYFAEQVRVLEGMYSALRSGGLAVVHAFAPRYSLRPSYILQGEGFSSPAVEELQLMLYGAGFKHVVAKPFRVLPDRGLELLSRNWLYRFFNWEMAHLPASWGMTYVLTGVK